MANEITVFEQTQALAETKRMNYLITTPQNKQIELVRYIDFQKIKGFKQPTLTKAGCLRIAKEGYGLSIDVKIEHAIEVLEPFPFFFYRAKVDLYTFTKDGERVIVSSGVGSANSGEARNGSKAAFDAANTALKFAEKRATSDSVINLTGLSNIFVQDMDSENVEKGYGEIAATVKDTDPITSKQVKRLYAIANENGMNVEQVKTFLTARGYASTKSITQGEYDMLCSLLAAESE